MNLMALDFQCLRFDLPTKAPQELSKTTGLQLARQPKLGQQKVDLRKNLEKPASGSK
jgi:hypothetical protein